MRLGPETLDALPRSVHRFSYDRTSQAAGIVHLGIGAFHRAHQAWYTDAAMDSGCRDWMIAGISLQSMDTAQKLNPQGGLYTLAERTDDSVRYRVVGSVREVVAPPRTRVETAGLIAAPATRVVSLTVTEKGYCRSADGSLDLATADAPTSLYPPLIEGLARRREAGLSGLTILSCDNLVGNGAQLARLVDAYCGMHTPAIARWIEAECAFPSTMVDRIVPATTDADLAQIEGDLGLSDAAAVLTEPFSQWVIEDRFAAGRPGWEKVGVELVDDVAPYETAKLRMLNGAHSALAYLGLERGHQFVHEAVADPEILSLIAALMRREAAGSLTPARGQNLETYADALLARFANRALNHRLAQIAIDGSQKLPQRWLEVLAYHQKFARECPSILTAVAAWLRHVRGDFGQVNDPLSAELKSAWSRAGKEGVVAAVFGSMGLVRSDWSPTDHDTRVLVSQL